MKRGAWFRAGGGREEPGLGQGGGRKEPCLEQEEEERKLV
jgi:hypothetical protein